MKMDRSDLFPHSRQNRNCEALEEIAVSAIRVIEHLSALRVPDERDKLVRQCALKMSIRFVAPWMPWIMEWA